jgi:hypothetical protein
MLKQCTLTNYNTGKVFLFKGSPSREGHETDFSVLTTIELCLRLSSQNGDGSTDLRLDTSTKLKMEKLLV